MNTKQNMNTLKWDNIPWALIEKYILQIQNRIYYAEKKNDKKHVYVLQNKLSKSWSLQTKIFFELCFMEKNIKQVKSPFSFFFSNKKKRNNVNELREILQTSFPFFYNNENIRNKIFSIFLKKKPILFCSKKSKKKNKSSREIPHISSSEKIPHISSRTLFLKYYSNKATKNLKSFFELSLDRCETKLPLIPTTLMIHLTNSKDQNSIILNKNFFIIKLILEIQNYQNKHNIGKFYLNDEPCKNYEIISLRVPDAKIKSLNCRTEISYFFSLSLLFFLKKNRFIDYKRSMTHKIDAPVFPQEIFLKYYQFQFLQHFFLFSTSSICSNISLKNLTFENSIFFIISKKNIYNQNNKKDEIRSHKSNYSLFREFDILFKEKIDFYRKSKCLETKIKSLLQIFYLTKDFSCLEKPFFLIQKTDDQILKKNKSFTSSSPFQFTDLNEKMSFLEIKKIIKLGRIKKKIEPQWQARYEYYSYSLMKGPSAFKKIQALYKTICDEPKFILKIELKSLSQDLFIEQLNDKRQDNFSLFPVYQFKNFIYLLKSFFFYGLEKVFFHILKKQYFDISNSFFKQILIFDKNQILILHENEIFLKKFCQFFFSSFLFFVYDVSSLFLFEIKEHRDTSIVDFKENIYSIKTQIVHSFMPYKKNPPGIDFLGFHINQLNKKQYLRKNIDLEYFKKPVFNVSKFNIQTFISPSLANVRNHLIQIRMIIKQSKTSTQELLIKRLSPKIRGWSKFYSQAFSLLDKKREYQKTAKYCDYLTFKMLWRWACRRHPNKNRKWIKLKYFKTLNDKNWVFCVIKKIEPVEKNSSHNSALVPLEKNFVIYATSLYLCLPLHREI